jgi:hypothetical protein
MTQQVAKDALFRMEKFIKQGILKIITLAIKYWRV